MNQLTLPPLLEDLCARRENYLRLCADLDRSAREATAAANAATPGEPGYGAFGDPELHSLGSTRHSFVEEARRKFDRTFWRYLLNRTGLSEVFDKQARDELEASLAGDPPPATYDAVKATLQTKIAEAESIMLRGLDNLFHKLAPDFKRNDPFRFGHRFALNYCIENHKGSWGNSLSIAYRGNIEHVVDLDRVLHILDGKPPTNHVGDVRDQMRAALHRNEMNLVTEYLDLRWYLNGNLHLKLVRTDQVERINLLLGRDGGIPQTRESKRRSAPAGPTPEDRMAKAATAIEEDVLDVLRRCRTDPSYPRYLFLPSGILERSLYKRVDKVLRAAGAAWKSGIGAHQFPCDAAQSLASILAAGTITDRKTAMQQFFTPPELAARIIRLAAPDGRDDDPQPLRGCRVLEPSAGKGALVTAAMDAGCTDITAVEADPDLCNHLALITGENLWSSLRVKRGDFLGIAAGLTDEYDAVVMNPPFADGQGLAHLAAAWELVKPSGKLVAILDAGCWYRSSHREKVFDAWQESVNAEVIALDPDTFKDAGTRVATRLLVARKLALVAEVAA